MKRVRQNEKRRTRNRHVLATLRSTIKTVRKAIETSDATGAKAALPRALKALEQAASKGVIHKRQASRKIGRLTKAVNAALNG